MKEGSFCGILPRKGKGKVKTSISLDPEIVQWIDKLIEKKRFARDKGLALVREQEKVAASSTAPEAVCQTSQGKL